MKHTLLSSASVALLLASAVALSCGESRPQVTDSQTNWLRSCQIDAQCDGLGCFCGVCTSQCADDDACSDLPGASCVAASESGTVAECGGTTPSAGLCMPRCDSQSCGEGKMCVAGVCTPVPDSTASVNVDTGARREPLVGFGATVAYVEQEITSHPQKEALYRALFADLGLDVLRLRNRYGDTGDDDLTIARDLIDAATESLGRTPTIFMTSWSPPPALKANGSTSCSGNADTCTLVKTADGAFDYASYAAYWRASLDAYRNVGVVPDYVGLQNNPNWNPTSSEVGEACRFLPVEGSATVLVRGTPTTATFPGYAEAQAATLAAFEGMPSLPKILAPETSDVQSVADYAAVLDFADVDAITHHLYGADPASPDGGDMTALGELASAFQRPIFQTEMSAGGLDTAVLIHRTATIEGASAYVQTTLTGAASGPTASPNALVGLDATSFKLQDAYFAMRHYARHTDPSWTRVDAVSSDANLLSSAWLSPGEDAVSVVLVNSGTTPIVAKLAVGGVELSSSEVVRTVFGGVERFVSLGSLSETGVLTVPGRSVVTVAYAR